MADKKISALTAATTPLAGTEVLPIVQGGTTKKVSVDDLTTGKVVTTGPIISVGAGKDRLVIEPQNAGSGALLLSTNAAGNAYTPVLVDGSTAVIKVAGTEVARTNSNGIAPVAGKGIDFSANGGDILTQYDEGTWVPVVTSSSGTITSYTSSGRYTRVGRMVTAVLTFKITDIGTATGVYIVTLPSPTDAAITYIGAGRDDNTGGMVQGRIPAAIPDKIYFGTYTGGSFNATNTEVFFTIQYFV
jgi:hypothetical protein